MFTQHDVFAAVRNLTRELDEARNVIQMQAERIELLELASKHLVKVVGVQDENLDWAETLLCSAERPPGTSLEEWRGIVKDWRDEKHEKHEGVA